MKTLTKDVSTTILTPFANTKFAEASTALTFETILYDIQQSTMVMSKRKTQQTSNDSPLLQVGSEQFTSDITFDAVPEPSSVALHNAIDQAGSFVHSHIESLALRRRVSMSSDACSHERRHATVGPDNERLCPTQYFDNPSEPVPLSMQMVPTESLAFNVAMGSKWTLRNAHHICGELKDRVADEETS